MGHSDADVADERDMLLASLDGARHAVVGALIGVPVALLREPLIWPDGSLLAIVKHLAYLERWWFAHTFAGLDVTFPWSDDDVAAEWRLERSDTAWRILSLYHGECRRSRLITERAALNDVAARTTPTGRTVALSGVVLHMIEETNHHAGHADVLRQLIEGAPGTPPCRGRDGHRHGSPGGDSRDRGVRRLSNPQA